VSRLQYVKPLKDQYVGAANILPLIRHDVVSLMGVDWRPDLRVAGFDVDKELHHPLDVIALGEPLAPHELLFFELAVGK